MNSLLVHIGSLSPTTVIATIGAAAVIIGYLIMLINDVDVDDMVDAEMYEKSTTASVWFVIGAVMAIIGGFILACCVFVGIIVWSV